jgi:hypothetical protein
MGHFPKLTIFLSGWPIGIIPYNSDLNLGALYIARYVIILAEEK